VQTGPQPPDRCVWLEKCAVISLERCAAACARLWKLHTTGAAPAIISSQRGQPAVLRPNTGPPQVCFVVVDFVQAISRAPLLWEGDYHQKVTVVNTKW
jgi:hypothetical protein